MLKVMKMQPATKTAAKAAWYSQCSLVDVLAKFLVLNTIWQNTVSQFLVELIPERQAQKAAWQGHSQQALVKFSTTCQTLEGTWKDYLLQVLVEFRLNVKNKSRETVWQVHSLEAVVDVARKVKLWRRLGKVTPSKLLLKLSPNVRKRKLLGKVT